MPKPRIYVETSVISYLTARPSRDVVNIVRQAASQALWNAGGQRFELVISELVLAEAQQGDPQAAALRLAQAQTLPLLDMLPEAADIATQLTQGGALPPAAYTDGVHIALAVLHEVDAIASWNFRHIASAWARSRIEHALQSLGYASPIIATPEELMEDAS
jgi:predicted nucleic acid-binding protein